MIKWVSETGANGTGYWLNISDNIEVSLFKDNKDLKNNLLILASLIAISLFSGYLILICETLLALL